MRERRRLAILALTMASSLTIAADLEYRIAGDGISAPLTVEAGDPARGRALVVARDSANCVLCHAVPDPAVRFAGDVGPSLAGAGRRLTLPQLRLRVVDEMQINRETVMPSYYKVSGLTQVAAPFAGKPILSAREVEDVVAWLATLQ